MTVSVGRGMPGRALAVLVLVLFAVACNRGGGGHKRGQRGGDAEASPAAVPTAVAKTATVRPTLAIAGVIAPLQNVAITSQLTEPADKVNVNEGDTVRAGEVIAVLDTADLRANLESDVENQNAAARTASSDDAKVAQAQYTAKLNIGQGNDSVNSARAALRQAQQTYTQAAQDNARDHQLVVQGYISQQAADQQATTTRNDLQAVQSAQAALQSAITNASVNGTQDQGLQAANVEAARAEAAAAHAQIGQAQATADQVRTQIAKATIVSPVNGVVVNRNLNPGEYPSGRTIFTIQQLDHVYAILNASSADVFNVRNGSGATVAVAGGNGAKYSGTVDAVLGQVTPGSTNFTVKVLLTNPDKQLVSGVPVTATISKPPATGVSVPTTAFLDDTHTSVIGVEGGTAKELHVKEVTSDGTTSVVTGIANGTTVVSNGQLGIAPGTQISQR